MLKWKKKKSDSEDSLLENNYKTNGVYVFFM